MPWQKGIFRLCVLPIGNGLTRFSSYKFHRLFPLSQYDLPSHNSQILSFPPGSDSSKITQEQISQNNPHVDYTRSINISLNFTQHNWRMFQTRSNHPCLLGRGEFNTWRRQSISGRHVCRLMIQISVLPLLLTWEWMPRGASWNDKNDMGRSYNHPC